MSRVTRDLQVTIPKEIAEQYGIAPGDEVEFVAAGPTIRMVPPAAERPRLDVADRLHLFDASVERQRARARARGWGPAAPGEGRGWTRDELYTRGSTG